MIQIVSQKLVNKHDKLVFNLVHVHTSNKRNFADTISFGLSWCLKVFGVNHKLKRMDQGFSLFQVDILYHLQLGTIPRGTWTMLHVYLTPTSSPSSSSWSSDLAFFFFLFLPVSALSVDTPPSLTGDIGLESVSPFFFFFLTPAMETKEKSTVDQVL